MTTSPTTDQSDLLREAFEAGVRAAESEGFIGMSEAVADQMFTEFVDSRDDNTRLTFTTPTLGDMVNEDDCDFTAGCPGYGAKNTRCSRSLGHEGGCHIFACLEVLEGVNEAEAAPASPIPTSVANEGEQGPGGTFACPICGDDKPHHHTPAVVDAYQNKRSRS